MMPPFPLDVCLAVIRRAPVFALATRMGGLEEEWLPVTGGGLPIMCVRGVTAHWGGFQMRQEAV